MNLLGPKHNLCTKNNLYRKNNIMDTLDTKLYEETFEEVRVVKARDYCYVISSGETVGEFYRRVGRNEVNREIYDKWTNPSFISTCLRILKKNECIERLPNGLTPADFSVDYLTGKYNQNKKKKTKKEPTIDTSLVSSPYDTNHQLPPTMLFNISSPSHETTTLSPSIDDTIGY